MTNFDDENFAIFGEALEQLDEDNFPRKKPVTVEDQYALDAQGRRRFHGAFTGGFSAGYFNSVDTRDGWIPHQFKSSRNNKAKSVCQRPEDFMDDEDTSEFGIAPTGIRTSNDFVNYTGRGTKREKVPSDNDGIIPGTPVLKELLKSVTDTVGVTLLKKMGWKPGQGVGPRLTKNKKKMVLQKNIDKKVYDCYLPSEEIETPENHTGSWNEDHQVDEEILFAPDDFEPFQCNPKDNYFGIGYRGLNELCVHSGYKNLIDPSVFQMHDQNKKLSIRGQAFGVGTFEVDDTDIYERDDMSCYDFVLGPESKNNRRWSKQNECQTSQRRCLKGFILARNRFERKIRWSLPKVPENFQTRHLIKQTRFSVAMNEIEISNKSKWKSRAKYDTNARDRGKILGDFNFSTNINSCIEVLQKCEPLIKHYQKVDGRSECRETSQTSHFVVKQKSLEERPLADTQKLISMPSWMNKLTTKSFVPSGIKTLRGDNIQSLGCHREQETTFLSNEMCDFRINERENFDSIQDLIKPSLHDVEKQSLSMELLQSSKIYDGEKCECIQPLSMQKWIRERDIEKFDHAPKLLEQAAFSQCDDRNAKGVTTKQNSVVNNVVMKAVKTKMFGKLTRTLEIWEPASAVCSRFNISQSMGGSLDFSGGIGTSNTKPERVIGTVSMRGDDNKSSKLCNFKLSSIDNELKLFNASSIDMISDHSNELQNLSNAYNKIPDKSITNNPEAKLTSKQYPEREYSSNGKIIEAWNNRGPNGETSMFLPSVIRGNVTNAKVNYDLFQAIFLSASESSESDNNYSDDMNNDTLKSQIIGKSSNMLNIKRNTSPAQGIFAQLNFDDMLAHGGSAHMGDAECVAPKNPDKFRLHHSSKSSLEEIISNTKIFTNNIDRNKSMVDISSDIYGPTLPINLVNINNQSSCTRTHLEKLVFENAIVSKLKNSEKIGVWVEKAKMKKSKKVKKKHKRIERHKGRKYKHKSKKN